MKTSQITGIPEIPKIPEINAEVIWKNIKHESDITKYFPERYITGARIPDRTYLILQLIACLYQISFLLIPKVVLLTLSELLSCCISIFKLFH